MQVELFYVVLFGLTQIETKNPSIKMHISFCSAALFRKHRSG